MYTMEHIRVNFTRRISSRVDAAGHAMTGAATVRL